jgi:Lon protease-like protein
MEVLPEEERQFILAWIRPGGYPDKHGLMDLFPVGVLAQVREITEYPDGRFDVAVVGKQRAEIVHVDATRPLLQARIQLLEDSDPTEGINAIGMVHVDHVVKAFTRYRELLALSTGNIHAPDDDLPSDPLTLSYLITAALVVPTEERARLLAAPSAGLRLTLAYELIVRENKVLQAFQALPAMDVEGSRPSPN